MRPPTETEVVGRTFPLSFSARPRRERGAGTRWNLLSIQQQKDEGMIDTLISVEEQTKKTNGRVSLARRVRSPSLRVEGADGPWTPAHG